MAVTVTVKLPDLSKAIRKAAAPAIQRKGDEYADLLVQAVKEEIVAAGLKTRPASRRRTPGSVHLINGWSSKVVGDPVNYPLLVNLVARGDAAFIANIRYQNDGTPGHTIRKRQSRTSGGQFGERGRLRFPDGGAMNGPPWVYAKQVHHPGTTGKHFIEKAAARVHGAHARAFA